MEIHIPLDLICLLIQNHVQIFGQNLERKISFKKGKNDKKNSKLDFCLKILNFGPICKFKKLAFAEYVKMYKIMYKIMVELIGTITMVLGK